MIKQIVQSNTQILFDYDAFARLNMPISIGQDPPPQGGLGGNSTGNDVDVASLDVQDAVQPITNQLRKMPLWWILEIFPTSYTYQNAQRKWVTTF
jgi:hypothetical protein